ncbi:MAG: cytochrome C oxidase subunit IV family protein [Spirochaetes bacterium]|nr:cytochrome C oxidase subunit IV family protein [Spirochaetota bacterium]
MESVKTQSLKYYFAVAASILVLVAAALAVHATMKGPVASALTLGLAGLQAVVVVLFSMGLRKEKGFNRLIFVASLMFLGFFIILTLADVLTRGDVAKDEEFNFSIKSPVKPLTGSNHTIDGHPPRHEGRAP